jgi:hypothetical protein
MTNAWLALILFVLCGGRGIGTDVAITWEKEAGPTCAGVFPQLMMFALI